MYTYSDIINRKKSNLNVKNYVLKVNEPINVQGFCNYKDSNPSLNSDINHS